MNQDPQRTYSSTKEEESVHIKRLQNIKLYIIYNIIIIIHYLIYCKIL